MMPVYTFQLCEVSLAELAVILLIEVVTIQFIEMSWQVGFVAQALQDASILGDGTQAGALHADSH